MQKSASLLTREGLFFKELFDALSKNDTLTDLSISNTTLGDAAAIKLVMTKSELFFLEIEFEREIFFQATAIETNQKLEKLNIESNNVSPQTLIKIFQVYPTFQDLPMI